MVVDLLLVFIVVLDVFYSIICHSYSINSPMTLYYIKDKLVRNNYIFPFIFIILMYDLAGQSLSLVQGLMYCAY